LLIEEQRVLPVWTYRWMLRLLDVRVALEERGYPPISGDVVLAVEDGLFPQNRGPWRVKVSEGVASVEPVDIGVAGHVHAISIGTLSSLYSGFLSARDAATLGLIEREHEQALARLFDGPAPWMHDFF
jgi:predicted acetyltransferase